MTHLFDCLHEIYFSSRLFRTWEGCGGRCWLFGWTWGVYMQGSTSSSGPRACSTKCPRTSMNLKGRLTLRWMRKMIRNSLSPSWGWGGVTLSSSTTAVLSFLLTAALCSKKLFCCAVLEISRHVWQQFNDSDTCWEFLFFFIYHIECLQLLHKTVQLSSVFVV